jgi:hypothetical protein
MLYTVYFEIFGKKMKYTVLAKSEEDAKYQIMGKIIWHKVTTENMHESDIVDDLMNIFGMKK